MANPQEERWLKSKRKTENKKKIEGNLSSETPSPQTHAKKTTFSLSLSLSLFSLKVKLFSFFFLY